MTTQVVAPAGGERGALQVRQVTLPPPAPHQVCIAVQAVGVNPTDWKGVDRAWPRTQAAPIGYEAAGVVTDLGSAVAAEGRLTVGNEVIAYPVPGAYASDLLADASDVLIRPAALDPAQAANLLLAGTTAADMIEALGISRGDTLVIHGGSGATGASALQQAHRLGAKVVATASSANADVVRDLGGQPVTHGPGLLDRLRAAAPQGFTAALDCVGTDEALEASLALVGRDRAVTIVTSERAVDLGVRFLGGTDPDRLAYRNAQRQRLVDLAAEGTLTVRVVRTWPLTAAAEALKVLRTGHPGGKLALLP